MKNEMRISVQGLRVGMFVSELEKPWIETKFPLQGLKINNWHDIDRIRSYCEHVVIDLDRGLAPESRYWNKRSALVTRTYGKSTLPRIKWTRETANSREFTRLRRTTYVDNVHFGTELSAAKEVSGILGYDFKQVIADLKQGRNLDIEVVKKGITAMVESIIRNPSAMIWMAQLKKKDEYSYSRALGTSVWCATFGRHLGLEKSNVLLLALGGLLLDVGKTQLPTELLHKKAPLDPRETKVVRSHVKIGLKILSAASKKEKGADFSRRVLEMVATHHERADGSGYPRKLANDQIPMFGRIAGIADSYDAMTTGRPFCDTETPKNPNEAIVELYGLRGTKFQDELVEQFIRTVGLYPTGSLVELNTGEVGVVVATHGLRRLRPTILLLLDRNKERLPKFPQIDLAKLNEDIAVNKSLPADAYGINVSELFV
jgi:HD-GYP domain-containing protein (c-di-GMP phosphodiesterase class II)